MRKSGLVEGWWHLCWLGQSVAFKFDVTASRNQNGACYTCTVAVIDRQYKHNTPQQLYGSCSVHSCEVHFMKPIFDAVPGLNRSAFIEIVDSRGHRHGS